MDHELILRAMKILATSDLTGHPDANWHRMCAQILDLGITQQSLEDFMSSHPPTDKGFGLLLEEGDDFGAASLLHNALDIDPSTIRYMGEIYTFAQWYIKACEQK